MTMLAAAAPKRGRGRPKGSLNRPKQPALSPEEAEALKRELAAGYVEAVTAEALAIDRKRRIKARLRATFGSGGLQDVEAIIVAAQERIGHHKQGAQGALREFPVTHGAAPSRL